jgi:hypothetical protein
VQFAYNEDLKQFNFNVVIMAFPGQSAGFGFGGQPSADLPAGLRILTGMPHR